VDKDTETEDKDSETDVPFAKDNETDEPASLQVVPKIMRLVLPYPVDKDSETDVHL
jgi:hypothetical protein